MTILSSKEKVQVDKYLLNYAEPEWQIGKWWCKNKSFSSKPVDRILTIPSCAENENLEIVLSSAANSASHNRLTVLVIVLVNHRDSAEKWVKKNNKNTLANWKNQVQHFEAIPLQGVGQSFSGRWNGLDLLFIDRANTFNPIPEKQGVGLVRKIICDVACYIWSQAYCKSHYGYTSDGDATLPLDYFRGEEWKNNKNIAAVIYPFKHVSSDASSSSEIEAMNIYDYYLRYFSRGLSSSNSPYAFPTIGSTISFSFMHYAKVRGFPRKEAGEDFYFLNKLRKLSSIIEKKGDPILLQGRTSRRVPFGTGKSIIKISSDLQRGEIFELYHPNVFIILKIFLKQAEKYCESCDLESFFEGCEYDLGFSQEKMMSSKAFSQFQIDDLKETLNSIGALIFMKNIPQKAKKNEQRLTCFHIWFDAFKTLKFIHYLRQNYFRSIPVSSELNSKIQNNSYHSLAL